MRRRSSAVILVASLLALMDAGGGRLAHPAEQPQKAAGATAAARSSPSPAANAPAAQTPAAPPPPANPKCWAPPPDASIWDIFQSQASALFASAEVAETERPVLALSSGDIEAAYSAGFLVGWGETGVRPEFAVVSAIGVSALIAPFAFIGRAGDQDIGDLYSCGAVSFKDLARAAGARLNEATLAAIASGHRSGRRLYLVTPSNGDRPAIVWDAGLIAAGGGPKALPHLRNILFAAADRTTVLGAKQGPIAAGVAAAEEDGFRLTGAGGLFFIPEDVVPSGSKQTAHYFLINNGKLRASENRAFMQFAHGKYAARNGEPAGVAMTTSFGVFLRAQRNRDPFHFAFVPATLPMTPEYDSELDFAYSREVFMRAWKTARAGGGWRTRLPGLGP